MKITVYLPDALGEQAKESDLNLSGLLRSAVSDELSRLDALTKLENGMETIELDLLDDEENAYIGTFDGKRMDENGRVFLTEDGRILFYDDNKQEVYEYDESMHLQDWLECDDEVYIKVMTELGEKPVVHI